MRNFVIIITISFVLGCADKPVAENLSKLNGYWEIAKVTFPNGQEKQYTISTTVDYIEIVAEKGFKKKMQPKLDGTYDTSNDAEFVTIIEKQGQLYLQYQNNLSQWEEQLTRLTDDLYSVKNEEGITYTYRRYIAINVKP